MTRTVIYCEPHGQFVMEEFALRDYGHQNTENLYFLGLHPLAALKKKEQAFKEPVWQGVVSEKELSNFKTFKNIQTLHNIFNQHRHHYYFIPTQFRYEDLSYFVTAPEHNLATAPVSEDLLMHYNIYERRDNATLNTPHYGNFFERAIKFFDLMDNLVYFSPQIYLGSFSENSEQAFDIRHALLKDKPWQSFVSGMVDYQKQYGSLYLGQNELFSDDTTIYYKDLHIPLMKSQSVFMAFNCDRLNMPLAYEQALQVADIESKNASQSELIQNIASLILLKIQKLDRHLGLNIMSLSKYIFQKDRGQILTHEKRTKLGQLFLYYDLEQTMQDNVPTINAYKI